MLSRPQLHNINFGLKNLLISFITKELECKAILSFKNNLYCCYAFLSDESLFTWFPFDTIVCLIIMVVDCSRLTYECLVYRLVNCQIVYKTPLTILIRFQDIEILYYDYCQ